MPKWSNCPKMTKMLTMIKMTVDPADGRPDRGLTDILNMLNTFNWYVYCFLACLTWFTF